MKSVVSSETKCIIAGLIANFLLSWTILPLAIPPSGFYSLRELMEVLLWQGISAVGWPFAIVGGFAGLFFEGSLSDFVTLLIVLIYPTILLLLLLMLFLKHTKRWMLILLHILLTFIFAAMWYQVRNGYDFMIG